MHSPADASRGDRRAGQDHREPAGACGGIGAAARSEQLQQRQTAVQRWAEEAASAVLIAKLTTA